MTEIKFEQISPRGNAVLDTGRLLVAPDGSMFLRTDGAPVPVSDEQRTALQSHGRNCVSTSKARTRSL
jgi:hypothetical protein